MPKLKQLLCKKQLAVLFSVGVILPTMAKDPLYENTRHPIPGHIESENFISIAGRAPTRDTPRGEAGAGESLFQPEPGSRANYGVDVDSTGRYEVKIRYSKASGGRAPISFNATSGGTVSALLPKTGHVSNFQTLTTTIDLNEGLQTLTMQFGGTATDWSQTYVNWIALRRVRATASPTIIEVSPTTGDDSSNSGPYKTVKRAFDRVAQLNNADPLHGPIEVRLNEGYHEIAAPIRLTSAHSGTADGPIILRKGRGSKSAIVGAGRKVPLSSLSLVEDSASLNRLKNNARGKVYRARLDDADWQRRFTRRIDDKHYEASVSYNNAYLMLARFPNIGLETAVEQNGSSFKTFSNIDGAAWAREFNRNQDMFVSGHMTLDEFEQQDFVGRVDADGRIHFESFTGLTARTRRVRILNVLAELDMPGEWYYDKVSKDFYIWPLAPLNLQPEIRVGSNFEMLNANGLEYWTVRDLVFSDTGGTGGFGGPLSMITMPNNKDLIFAGNTVRNSNARVAARFDNCVRCEITGNDFYDLFSPFVLTGGGSRYPVQPSQSEFTNNHIYRLRNRAYGGGGIGGPAVRFANNLIHGVQSGQTYTGSTDALMELNEWYDSGYELGDWNVAYVGASYATLGNLVRHNFVHNLVRAPDRKRIGSFRYDDGGKGMNFIGNILYRTGEYALALGGSGGTVNNNITFENQTFLLTGAAPGLIGREVKTAADVREEFDLHLNAVPDRIAPSKTTYLYNAQRTFGVNRFWDQPYFEYKYPVYDRAYDINPFRPIGFEAKRNYIVNVRRGADTRLAPGTPDLERERIALSTLEFPQAPVRITEDAFENLDYFDMRLKPGFQRQSGFYDIPFDDIGLYIDEYRKSVPHKRTYRAESRLKWSNDAGRKRLNIPSHNNPYDNRAFGRTVVYDLGSYTSPLFLRAKLLTPETQGTYGWTNTSGIRSVDRGDANNRNALNRDIIFSSQARTFEQDVENGPWYALITFGDTFRHDNQAVDVEGVRKLSNITTNANEYRNEFVSGYVNDGKLSITFSDQGGSDPNWVISRIITQNVPFAGQAGLPPQDDSDSGGDSTINIPGRLQAEDFIRQNGIQTLATTDTGGGELVGFIQNGEWTEYTINVATAGTYSLSARVASATGGGRIQLLSNGSNVGSVNVAGTGGWQTWATVNTTVQLSAGVQTLRLNYTGGSGFLFNVNWLDFTRSNNPDPDPDPDPNPGGGDANCPNIKTGGQSGNFNTNGAYCFKTKDAISGWGASNIDGRSISVTINGRGPAVTVVGGVLPPKGPNDYYHFNASAGQFSWASIFWWQ